jgi:1-acyl-sn-glycerol-3-phosphate acyltransferase
VWLSILGLSWFWGVGWALLTLLPNFTRDTLGASEGVVTLFLALFCAGVGIGSLLCERLSSGRLELGLVPVGSIGLSVFAVDLFLAGRAWPAPGGPLLSTGQFLAHPGGVRLCIDLGLLALSSGLYTVPLYTLIQRRADPEARSRVIAANNVMNAAFMVGGAVLLMALHALNVSIPATFLVLALLNAAVAAYIYTIIPEFLLRFVVWSLARVMYRLRVVGDERIPLEGPAVLVANHVSFVDWMLVSAASPRPVRFVMDHAFLKLPLVGFIFRDAGVIPIAPKKENAALLERAFDLIAEALANGDLVCIFPEGGITRDGRQQPFRQGIERIVARTPVAVIPLAITGMWGSFFSRERGRRLFRRLWSRVGLVVGEPVPAASVTAAALAADVAALGGWEPAPAEPARAAG